MSILTGKPHAVLTGFSWCWFSEGKSHEKALKIPIKGPWNFHSEIKTLKIHENAIKLDGVMKYYFMGFSWYWKK